MHADNFFTSHLHRKVLCLLAAVVVAACSSKESTPIASQVAAKVGSEEISVHQINQALASSNTANASAQDVTAMGRLVLEKLIDQQLAVEQAVQSKLNRSPEVVTQLETSRRDILAGAYIKQIASGVTRPTPEETRKYFDTHPALFAQRRVFTVQEIVVAPNSGVSEQLRSFASTGKPMEQIATWLKEKNVLFSGGVATRAAEQIPLEMLPAVNAMTDGQTAVIETLTSLTVLHLISSQSVPVTEAVAMPRIAQFLLNQSINTTVASSLLQLRAANKVTYMGEFAKAAVSQIETSRTAIDKGLAGLK
jgi:EpsD family peptidyl-prolyl cis-trans isomerase